MVYGNSKVSNVGCGVIATYNLMKALNKFTHFPLLITEFEMNDMTWLGGS